MFKECKHRGCTPVIISNERNEGHGIRIDKVPNEINLLIVVDSSTNSVEECKTLHEQGIDIVILDHHEKEVENPYALICNPQCCDYENKQLSGVGVCYQAIRMLDSMYDNDGFAETLLDVVALGLIGDCMNVTSPETRYLIYEGLCKMHDNPDFNLGLLLKKTGKHWHPNSRDVGFYVAPFINAIIRLGDIYDAINILISDNEDEIKTLLKKNGKKNETRKGLQAEAINKIIEKVDLSHKICIVDITDMDISSGMTGLLAGSLAEKVQKPVLIGKKKEIEGKILLCGSARSFGAVPLKEILEESKLFDLCQGHSQAFGIELAIDNVDSVYKYADKELERAVKERVAYYDIELTEDDLTYELLRNVEYMSFICGQGFDSPTFLIQNLSIDEPKLMKDIHLKYKAGEDLEVLKFSADKNILENKDSYMVADCIGSIGINSYYHRGLKETIHTRQVVCDEIDLF